MTSQNATTKTRPFKNHPQSGRVEPTRLQLCDNQRKTLLLCWQLMHFFPFLNSLLSKEHYIGFSNNSATLRNQRKSFESVDTGAALWHFIKAIECSYRETFMMWLFYCQNILQEIKSWFEPKLCGCFIIKIFCKKSNADFSQNFP